MITYRSEKMCKHYAHCNGSCSSWRHALQRRCYATQNGRIAYDGPLAALAPIESSYSDAIQRNEMGMAAKIAFGRSCITSLGQGASPTQTFLAIKGVVSRQNKTLPSLHFSQGEG